MKNEKGQTLIEAILALSVAVVIVTAVVTAVISALSGSNASINQNAAANLAQEAIDRARDIKTQDFASFTTTYPTNTYCMNSSNNLVAYSAGCAKIQSMFTRSVYINHSGQDQRISPNPPRPCVTGSFIAVRVTWADSTCQSGNECRKVDLSSCFTNSNALQNP